MFGVAIHTKLALKVSKINGGRRTSIGLYQTKRKKNVVGARIVLRTFCFGIASISHIHIYFYNCDKIRDVTQSTDVAILVLRVKIPETFRKRDSICIQY